MIVKAWRTPVTTAVALAVLVAYSVPVGAFPRTKAVGKFPASAAIPRAVGDDDDDGLSGGALAVLLLAIGGAVAGVLYARVPQGGPKRPGLTVKVSNNTVEVSSEGTNALGKATRSEWKATLDKRSQIIELVVEKVDGQGHTVRGQWKGKVDGRFYPVTVGSESEQWSYSKLDARRLAFTYQKAGRVTISGQIAAARDGRSFTVSTKRMDSVGRRVNTDVVYERR